MAICYRFVSSVILKKQICEITEEAICNKSLWWQRAWPPSGSSDTTCYKWTQHVC